MRYITLLIVLMTTALLAKEPTPADLDKVRAAAPATAPAKPAKARRVLIFNKPGEGGFIHSSIETGTHAVKILGEKTGAYTVDVTGDPAALNTENLKQYDAVAFVNVTGKSVPSTDQRAALLAFVQGGKGIIGIHSASDANYDWDDYGLMIGGWFDGHPWTAGDKVTVKIDDSTHPLTQHMGGKPFEITDEIYQFRIWPYSRKRLHILLSLDNAATQDKPGMKRGVDGDYAVAWVHKVGEGRAFYCSLGHREDIYMNPAIMAHYLAGIQYALGDLPAPDSPSEAGEPEPKPHAQLIEKLKGYTKAGDPAVIQEMETLARNAKGNADATARIEYAMIVVLGDPVASVDVKKEIARRLWLVPSDSSVIALSGMVGREELSADARYSLERIDHPYASYFLVNGLNMLKGNLRIGAINTIGVRRDANAAPALANLAITSDRQTRQAAIAALVKIGGEPAAKAVAEARAKAVDVAKEELTDAYLSIADGYLDANQKEKATAIYRELFVPTEPEHVRVAALRGLVGTTENPITLLVEQIGGSDAQVKVAAVRLLQEVRDPKATQAIVAALDSAAPSVQAVLTDALAKRGDKSAADAVAKLADAQDPGVKLAATKSLGKLGNAGHAPLLAGIASQAKGELRDGARLSLATLRGPDVNDAILNALQTANPDVAVELVRSLGERQADTAVGKLMDLAGSKADGKVRREAFRVLGDLAGTGELVKVATLLGKESDPGVIPAAEKAALTLAQRSGDPNKAVAEILSVNDAFQGTGRAALLRLLTNLGGPQALQAVRTELKSGDPATREAAARALANWPTADAAADLLNLAQSGDGSTKLLGLRGYIRVVGLVTDPAARADMYSQALTLAQRPDEKRLVLAGLAQTPTRKSLELAKSLAADTTLKAEAEQAVAQIEQSLAANAQEARK